MRTNVYIDAFNLYYGCLRSTPFKWLDVAALCHVLLPRDNIQRIKYFTAVVEARPGDPSQRVRQQFYLRALATTPKLSIYYGHFLSHAVAMPLADNPRRRVMVIKTEEKGSDVNLATELLVDGFNDDFDVAVVLSNDSDLLAPIRVVRRQMGKRVGVLNPQRVPSIPLEREADFLKSIRPSALRRSQFPRTMKDARGSFHRPPVW